MKISYLVTCSTETTTLNNLLYRIINTMTCNDEIIILQDKTYFIPFNETYEIILKYFDIFLNPLNRSIKHFTYSLDNNYGAFKNFGIEQCNGNYIFQCDGDELPSELTLGENLHSIIEHNPDIECFIVPRMNLFEGVTEKHAMQWGWKLINSRLYNKPIVNAFDPQYRIFKRNYPRISYKRKLHERIEGYTSFSLLPQEEEWCMLHVKSIDKQIETNIKYNTLFTQEENKGWSHNF